MSEAASAPGLSELLGVLTPKQRRWAEAYAGEAAGNGVKACELAGYSGTKETNATTAYDNLRNPKIRAVLDAYQEGDPLIATRVERLRWLTRVLRGEEKDERLDKDGCRVELRASIASRLQAAELLSKAAGEHIVKAPEDDGDDEVERMSTEEIAAETARLKGK